MGTAAAGHQTGVKLRLVRDGDSLEVRHSEASTLRNQRELGFSAIARRTAGRERCPLPLPLFFLWSRDVRHCQERRRGLQLPGRGRPDPGRNEPAPPEQVRELSGDKGPADTECPEGLVIPEVPAARYVVFRCTVATIHDAYEHTSTANGSATRVTPTTGRIRTSRSMRPPCIPADH